jgi:hypothetical protein
VRALATSSCASMRLSVTTLAEHERRSVIVELAEMVEHERDARAAAALAASTGGADATGPDLLQRVAAEDAAAVAALVASGPRLRRVLEAASSVDGDVRAARGTADRMSAGSAHGRGSHSRGREVGGDHAQRPRCGPGDLGQPERADAGAAAVEVAQLPSRVGEHPCPSTRSGTTPFRQKTHGTGSGGGPGGRLGLKVNEGPGACTTQRPSCSGSSSQPGSAQTIAVAIPPDGTGRLRQLSA